MFQVFHGVIAGHCPLLHGLVSFCEVLFQHGTTLMGPPCLPEPLIGTDGLFILPTWGMDKSWIWSLLCLHLYVCRPRPALIEPWLMLDCAGVRQGTRLQPALINNAKSITTLPILLAMYIYVDALSTCDNQDQHFCLYCLWDEEEPWLLLAQPIYQPTTSWWCHFFKLSWTTWPSIYKNTFIRALCKYMGNKC